jgi:hypothetical protein
VVAPEDTVIRPAGTYEEIEKVQACRAANGEHVSAQPGEAVSAVTRLVRVALGIFQKAHRSPLMACCRTTSSSSAAVTDSARGPQIVGDVAEIGRRDPRQARMALTAHAARTEADGNVPVVARTKPRTALTRTSKPGEIMLRYLDCCSCNAQVDPMPPFRTAANTDSCPYSKLRQP